MSLQACANLVARADPERFAATMAAPLTARAVLLPIYAASVEVARAPWLTQEALDAMVLARRWDIYKEGFNTVGDVLSHVQTITLGPMLAALEALDHLPEDLSALKAHATQLGLARFLRGVPALIERKTPVWAEDQKLHIYRDLCIQALDMTSDFISSPALIETAHCRRALGFVRKYPSVVEIGAIPEFRIGAVLSRGWLAWRCR
jgi:phytoene synthase